MMPEFGHAQPPTTWDLPGYEHVFHIDADHYGQWLDRRHSPEDEHGNPIAPDAAVLLYDWHWDPRAQRWHGGAVLINGRGSSRLGHDLVSINPLTFSPSWLCDCGDHGWVRDGKWVPA